MRSIHDHVQEFDYCTYCPKLCAFSCPVSNAEHSESVNPWAKMTLANLLRKEMIPLDADTAEPLYHCLGCQLCTTYCKHENLVGEALTAVRSWLIQRGVVLPALTVLRESYARYGHPYGRDCAGPLRHILDEGHFEADAQAVFYADARTILERPQEIRAAFSIFAKLRIEFMAIYGGRECDAGLALYRAGFIDEFAAHAKRLFEGLAGHKLIVTPSAEAAYTLKVLFAEFGFDLSGRVQHLVEFLAPYLRNSSLARRVGQIATYHDPSYLGRFLGITKQPREILDRLLENAMVEPVWSGSSAYPAGSTGCFPFTHPEVARDIAKERLRQAREVRADLLVTASSPSAAHLAAAREPDDVEVRTLTELIDHGLAAR